MKICHRWAEAVRCPVCALAGIASVTSDKSADTVHRLPEGFKIVKMERGDVIYCAICNRTLCPSISKDCRWAFDAGAPAALGLPRYYVSDHRKKSITTMNVKTIALAKIV